MCALKTSEKYPAYGAARPFFLGGWAACMATCVMQPIDMVKVRLQLAEGKGAAPSPIKVARDIIAKDGFGSLYTGLSAGLARQLTYGTTRLGVFKTLESRFKANSADGKTLKFQERVAASLCAGGLGALVGTPADAALVRMQADTVLPEAERRGYKNVVDALLRMAREEGLKGFFSGASPTVYRGLSMNVGMLTTYEPYKNAVKPFTGEGQANRFIGGFLSGWTAATVALPFDFIKTRLQKDNKGEYKNFLDCARKVAANEGPMAFYKGYATFIVRIAPHIMLTWVFMDNLQAIKALQ
jgi:solute carrier family 25 oxoglutarate transporter 11